MAVVRLYLQFLVVTTISVWCKTGRRNWCIDLLITCIGTVACRRLL